MSDSRSATDLLIDFALDVDVTSIPELARTRGMAAIADTVGVMLAGVASEVVEVALAALADAGALAGKHLIVGSDLRAGLLDAALVNAISVHALDFDDVNHPGPMHPSCHLVPTLLAISELVPVTGGDLLNAFIVGFEVDAKLGRLLNPSHYDRGWHATSTIGTIAAAAAAARLLELDRAMTEHCIGIAASSAAGLRGNIGSMTKPLHAGAAARAAVQAALLARRGFTSVAQSLDHKHGYLAAFAPDADTTHDRLRELGTSWEITSEFGIGLKPYPCCGEATAAVECGLMLREQAAAVPIDKVHVRTNARATKILTYQRPHDVEQARFSMPFCVATALVSGRADLRAFSDEAIADPAVSALIERVEHVIDDEHRDEREFGAIMELTLADGSTLRHDAPVAKGWADRWLSAAEQQAKFLMCAEDVISEASARELQERLTDLDTVTDVRDLISRLAVK